MWLKRRPCAAADLPASLGHGECGMSRDDRTALGVGLGLAAAILLVVLGIWTARAVHKRRKAHRVRNESAARAEKGSRSSVASIISLFPAVPLARKLSPEGERFLGRLFRRQSTPAEEYTRSPTPSDESFSAAGHGNGHGFHSVPLHDPFRPVPARGSHSPYDPYAPPAPPTPPRGLPRLSADGRLLPSPPTSPRTPPRLPLASQQQVQQVQLAQHAQQAQHPPPAPQPPQAAQAQLPAQGSRESPEIPPWSPAPYSLAIGEPASPSPVPVSSPRQLVPAPGGSIAPAPAPAPAAAPLAPTPGPTPPAWINTPHTLRMWQRGDGPFRALPQGALAE